MYALRGRVPLKRNRAQNSMIWKLLRKRLALKRVSFKNRGHVLRDCLKNCGYTLIGDTYPLLPVDVPLNGNEIHFYNEPFGYHISVFVFPFTLNNFTPHAFFTGKLHQQKVSIVIAKLDGVSITLATDDSNEFDILFKSLVFNSHNLII